MHLRPIAVRIALAAVALAGLAAWALAGYARDLNRTRRAVAAYARIVAHANAGDLATVRSLCTERYLATHPVEPARGGGVVGFPRQVHPNFRAWAEGGEVRLCPSNRVGLVYRLVEGPGGWRFDGAAGLIGPDGRVIAPPGGPAQNP